MKTIQDLHELIWGSDPKVTGGMRSRFGRHGKHMLGHQGQAYKAKSRRRAARKAARR